MDHKKTAAMTLILFSITCCFIYSYSLIGVKLSDTVDLITLIKLASIGTIAKTAITCFFAALSVFAVLFFASASEKNERITASVLSFAAALPVAFLIFENKTATTVMLLFYLLGLIFLSISEKKQNENSFEKMKTGWSASKKMVYALAIGGLLTSAFFAYTYSDEYESTAKQSIITMSMGSISSMNMSEQKTAEIIEKSVTKEMIEEMLREEESINFDSLTPEAQELMVNMTYSNYVSYLTQSISSASNSKLSEVQGRMSEEVLLQAMESVPVIKIFFDYLPAIIGMTVLTAIILFGELFITPMASLMSITLPKEDLGRKDQSKMKPFVEKFSGLPFEYQEKQREEERLKYKKEGI